MARNRTSLTGGDHRSPAVGGFRGKKRKSSKPKEWFDGQILCWNKSNSYTDSLINSLYVFHKMVILPFGYTNVFPQIRSQVDGTKDDIIQIKSYENQHLLQTKTCQ